MKFNCSYSELVDPKTVIPLSENPNIHSKEQIKSLAEIIKYQGQRLPIIIDIDKGDCVAGNGRLEAIRDVLRWDKIAVDYQKFENEDQRKAFIISENAISEWAHLDLGMINTQLADFDPSFNIDLLGIKDFVLEPMEKFEPLADEDDVPEVVHPITRKGDIWLLGNHRLMCGDSTMINDVEKLMRGEKADMVFTDPPYGVDYKGINNDSRGGLEDLLDGAFSNYFATSKSGASIYVFHSDRCADIFHNVFRRYFHFSSMIIWNKNSLTLSQTDYQSKHEPCMYGWMNNGSHKFLGDRKQTSVWDVHKESIKGHTTPKPIALIEKALFNSSKSGDLVADFFQGSGSTIIACEKNNRKCFGMELDEKYCDVIINRWQNFTGKKATLELTGQTYEELKTEREAI